MFATARSRTAAVAALALALAGCAGGGDGGDGDGGGGGDGDGGGGGKASGEEDLGPLDKIFQDIYGDWDEEQGQAQQMRVEEIVAECMAEQGFEYTPVDYSQASFTMTPDDLDVEWGTREFAEKYGYGATTDPWGNEEAMAAPSDQEWVDPNQDYVMSMSETEQAAYNSALYGDQSYPEGEDVEWEYKWEEAGCQGLAQHEVYETAPGLDDDTYQALMDEMSTMWEGIMNDPRLTELSALWATCMAEAGHPGFTTVDDAQNSIYEQLNAVWDVAYTDMPPDSSEEDWAAVQSRVDDLMAEITPIEIELAVADFDCREEVDYDKVELEVTADAQQQFYDAHKDELEAWREGALAARG